MKQFSIQRLAQVINAKVSGPVDGIITGLATDSRSVRAGDCFFAIKGENFDGHDFVPAAFAKGAVCAVVGKALSGGGRGILQVPDTIKALGDFAGLYRREQNFKVVAVTGSAGKTTTRQMIFEVLKPHFRCHQSPESFNTDIGLPLTLLGADPEHEIVIAELGSNHPGEIENLSRIAQPDVALVTNVHPAHLAGFGNLQSIIQEKVSITKGLKAGSCFIINGEIAELVKYCRSKGLNFLTFGQRPNCDISVENISTDGLVGRFTIDDTEVLMPLPGRANIENAIAAWAVAGGFGIHPADFAKALRALAAAPMRMELIKIGALTVLNDCYNANPASMKNALDCLARLGSSENRRLVFICGPMLELGGQSEMLHAELGREIAATGVKLLLAVGPFADITANATELAADKALRSACFADSGSVCNNLEKFVKPDDIILVKASRACKLEVVIEKLRQLFA